MSHLNSEDLLDVAVEASLAASHIIMESLGDSRVANFKGKTNLVTETDVKSENTIKAILKEAYPEHGILAEESMKENSESDYLWIIDPLDGTTNFVHGYPSFAISIGLFYKANPIVGVVLEMPHIKLYTAIKGNGAWCEGSTIKCSNTPSIQNSLLVTGFGYDHDILWKRNMMLFKHFTNISQGVRRLGAASIDICHVAAGKVDGYWEFDLKPWDMAAGILIAEEAGCKITSLNGGNHNIYDNSILITNNHIHRQMVEEASSI